MNQYFIYNKTDNITNVLNWEILHFYPLNELISIWCLLQVYGGQQRAEKAIHFEKN